MPYLFELYLGYSNDVAFPNAIVPGRECQGPAGRERS